MSASTSSRWTSSTARCTTLAETPRIAFGDARSDASGVALQVEFDPLLRWVARKRLICTAAFRRRDRLILDVAAAHTGRTFDRVRTEVAWGPVFSHDPGGCASPRPRCPRLSPAAPRGDRVRVIVHLLGSAECSLEGKLKVARPRVAMWRG